MEDLRIDLDLLLKAFRDGDDSLFDSQLSKINETYKSEEERKLISEYVEKMYSHAEEIAEDLSIRMQLAEISDFINLSAIARHYFGKSKDWLYQRINGNKVNGREATFTPDEIKIFNSALSDLSIKLGSMRLQLIH
ncbi:MAG: DUF5053 domain-containing protein [Staphylococcus sp.]|nr:DUF5053 domain-containing protein [Staphylococcus sp.]